MQWYASNSLWLLEILKRSIQADFKQIIINILILTIQKEN